MKSLTERQQQIVDYISNFTTKNNYPPSIRDIATHFGFSTKASYDHLNALKKKNIIKTEKNTCRSISIVQNSNSDFLYTQIPLIKKSDLHQYFSKQKEENYSEEKQEKKRYSGYVCIPSDLAEKYGVENLYAFPFKGNSMIGDGINSNDIAVLRKTKFAEDKSIVLAETEDENDIVLRHYYKNGNEFELRPSNSAYKSLVSKHCIIYGKLVMVMRYY